MTQEVKIFSGIIGFTVLLVVVFAFWQGGKKSDAELYRNELTSVVAKPESYELGEVPINGGLVTKEYDLKNNSGTAAEIKNISTSCMCTQAKAVRGGNETGFFGMEHPGDSNPAVDFEIPAGESVKIVVQFDPAAHGPTGTGPFDRTVRLNFSNPAGYKLLLFNGNVVSS